MANDNQTQKVDDIISNALSKIEPSVLSVVLTNSNGNGNGKRKRFCDADDDGLSKKFKDPESSPSMSNDYNGWTVPSPKYNIPKISVADMTPQNFYKDYISKRRPVVLKGKLQDLNGLEKWKTNNDHMKERTGKEQVMVEIRSNENDSFGRGNEIKMSFHQFLQLVKKGDSMHYLTTQDVEANQDGQPDLMAPLMKALKDDFPLRPEMMGNIIPQNINLWMGNNKDGASSGLHHDYHDNLYIVLRGRKRFRLYSPADSEKLYSRGKLLKVHPNGRINYEGEETTAYGADLKSDAAAKSAQAKEDAEQMLFEAEQAVKNGDPGAEEQLERAEEMLEEAMDSLLDAEMDSDGDDDNDDDDICEEDDFFDEDNNDDERCEGKREKYLDDDEEEEGPFSVADKESTETSRRLVDKTVKNPDNFSKIDIQILDDNTQLEKLYPEASHANDAWCDINVGDILYLPASWWHEVTSFGGESGHLAFNYWFHPPDSVDDFENPYSSNFWSNDYNLRFAK
mmetsp:Transcript_21073/g.24405  ORF Transcript_21073/g.24405 Transcript_21073/m.24405 type:complete len:510 (-) Transcript_21073:2387-3916(-)